MEQPRGIWTTEFWLTLLHSAVAVLVAYGAFSQVQADDVNVKVAALIAAIIPLVTMFFANSSYIQSRTAVKTSEPASPPMAKRLMVPPLAAAFAFVLLLSPQEASAVEPGYTYAQMQRYNPTALLPWRSNVEQLLQQIATNQKQMMAAPADNGQLAALQMQIAALNARLDQIAMMANQRPQLACPCPLSVQHPNPAPVIPAPNTSPALPPQVMLPPQGGIITIPAPPVIIHQSPPYYIPPLGAPVNPAPLGSPVAPAPIGNPVQPAPIGNPVVPPKIGSPVAPPPVGAPVAPAVPVNPLPAAGPVGTPGGSAPPPGLTPVPDPSLAVPPIGPPASMQRLVPARHYVWFWIVTDSDMVLIREESPGVGVVYYRQRNNAIDPRIIANCRVYRQPSGVRVGVSESR
jgi:hypothetical protein